MSDNETPSSGKCPFPHGESPADSTGKCPVMHGGNVTPANQQKDWWPNALDLDILHQQDRKTDPMDADFDYRKAVKV